MHGSSRTCVGGDVSADVAAPLGAEVEGNDKAVLSGVVVEALQDATGLFWWSRTGRVGVMRPAHVMATGGVMGVGWGGGTRKKGGQEGERERVGGRMERGVGKT